MAHISLQGLFVRRGRSMERSAEKPDYRLSGSTILFCARGMAMADINKAYKHIFTSPSSVGKEPCATRSGNARLHDMTHVTRASIAYIVTQVSMSVF